MSQTTIDLDRIAGADLATVTDSWDERDVLIYHLGVGCTEYPSAALPTFATRPVAKTVPALLSIPGLPIDIRNVLHGEHELVLHRPPPLAADVTHERRVTGLYDKGRSALLAFEITTRTSAGELLATNRASAFIKDLGGFGGEPGPKSSVPPVPGREPDVVAEIPTLPQQALMYSLAGDRNRVHTDAAFAREVGFERPILQGLCTFGIVARAAVERTLDGNIGALGSFRARFAGHVLVGETIRIRMWRLEGQVRVEAEVVERGTPVLTNAVIGIVSAA